MSGRALRGLYFGVHDVDYPRNRRVREYLNSRPGHTVETMSIEAGRGYKKNFITLARAALAKRRSLDYVIVAEFSIQFAFLGWIAARRNGAVLVVDWFIGLYETRVEDYSSTRVRADRRALYRLLDHAAARMADVLITDTEIRAQALRANYRLPRRPLSVPVGAPSWATPVPGLTSNSSTGGNRELQILYYGNFLPLHGIPIVLHALREAIAFRSIGLTLIGRGPEFDSIRALVSELQLEDSCLFIDPIAEKQLWRQIQAHDVVLGVFGESTKAKSVIANKVWQGLACGKIVVTRESDALAEIKDMVGTQLVQVKEPSRNLARTLVGLDPQALTASGHARPDLHLERYVEGRLDVLAAKIEHLCAFRRPGFNSRRRNAASAWRQNIRL